jgi:cellulose synthase/poly-beta-1,6-N-acetylglucosamine synthase-like glycosyltransferase
VEVFFWTCCAVLLWTYAGYPALMVGRAALRRDRDPSANQGAPLPPHTPSVTVILAVRNVAAELESRVENLLEQQYPPELLDIVIACNGCTDETEAVARRLAASSPRVTMVCSAAEAGKAGALNSGAAVAGGEVLVFADARQRFDPRAVCELMAPLRDAKVGGVTGRLLIGNTADAVVAGVGRYWQLETQLRLAESQTGSVVGATGAIYAVRRRLFQPLPSGVLLDDVYLPMSVVRQGYRICMAPAAVAYDRPSADGAAEYRRRVRTLVGNLELLRLMPGLLLPVTNPIFVRYISHKLLRVLTPVFCVGVVVSGMVLTGWLYRGPASALLAIYALGALGMVVQWRLLAVPSAFLLLHRAGFTALLRPTRRASDIWVP